jgi:cytochrome bd-type quinol oxidase subunit 2
MRPSIQLFFSAASFAAVFLIGLVFGMEFWQAGIHFEKTFEGRPIPRITELFVSNFWLASLLLSLPWFALLGLPLAIPRSGIGFRSPESYVTRYLAFLSIELFLVFVIVQALLMPYFSYYAVLSSPDEASVDLVPAAILALASIILIVALARGWKVRRTAGGVQNTGA